MSHLNTILCTLCVLCGEIFAQDSLFEIPDSITVKDLPDNQSLVARKILLFDKISEIRELRQHIQSLSNPKP